MVENENTHSIYRLHISCFNFALVYYSVCEDARHGHVVGAALIALCQHRAYHRLLHRGQIAHHISHYSVGGDVVREHEDVANDRGEGGHELEEHALEAALVEHAAREHKAEALAVVLPWRRSVKVS